MRHGHRRESNSPSPNPKLQARLRKLEELEEKEREEEQRRRYEEEQRLKKLAEREKKEKEEKMMEDAIKQHNAKELEKAVTERRQKEEAEKAFRERVKTVFGKAGYSDESIERILENKGKSDHGGHEGQKKVMDLARPTYIKVHRKHLSPDTLDAYDLPWEPDEVRPCHFSIPPSLCFAAHSVDPLNHLTDPIEQRDGNYIIIKRWIPEHDQDILFEHTRKLRERRPLLRLTDTSVEVKKGRDEMFLVRRKSPARRRSVSRSWMFT